MVKVGGQRMFHNTGGETSSKTFAWKLEDKDAY
jgi:hypothetical protein